MRTNIQMTFKLNYEIAQINIIYNTYKYIYKEKSIIMTKKKIINGHIILQIYLYICTYIIFVYKVFICAICVFYSIVLYIIIIMPVIILLTSIPTAVNTIACVIHESPYKRRSALQRPI